ncbi:hypothetical protein SBV1_860005 [Verrucomicrobia bacterium]|nr:hypothetical protein SBV1_860005 [Verrucomicrobiota bacterium]
MGRASRPTGRWRCGGARDGADFCEVRARGRVRKRQQAARTPNASRGTVQGAQGGTRQGPSACTTGERLALALRLREGSLRLGIQGEAAELQAHVDELAVLVFSAEFNRFEAEGHGVAFDIVEEAAEGREIAGGVQAAFVSHIIVGVVLPLWGPGGNDDPAVRLPGIERAKNFLLCRGSIVGKGIEAHAVPAGAQVGLPFEDAFTIFDSLAQVGDALGAGGPGADERLDDQFIASEEADGANRYDDQ